MKSKRWWAGMSAAGTAGLMLNTLASAQGHELAQQQTHEASRCGTRIANGARHGLPVEVYAVVAGTRFLVSTGQRVALVV